MSTARPDKHLSTFGTLPCAQCGAELKQPTWSEPVNQRRVRHLWNCQNCGYEFETMVVFGDEVPPLAA